MDQEAQRNNFMANFNSNYRLPFKNHLPTSLLPRPPTVSSLSEGQNRMPGGLLAYNNFYLAAAVSTPQVSSMMNCMPRRAPIIASPTTLEEKNGQLFVLRPDVEGATPLNAKAVTPAQFITWAVVMAKIPGSPLTQQFLPLKRTEAEMSAMTSLNSILCGRETFGIYSESPFLRPLRLLRRVQLAAPAHLLFHYPDPDNMIRSLRDLADQRVASIPLLAILSGAKPTAASLGFHTDYLTHSFNLDLDIQLMRFLVEQSRHTSSRMDKYRIILRLGWATTGFYVPPDCKGTTRLLASEMLPRCLSIRVARRNVTLPDPIFHSGQPQKLGHRLRFSIDITDRIPIRSNTCIRERNIEIEVTWLHVPLEDHGLPLLEMVASGSCTPLFNHLLNLPLIQVSLDRQYSVGDLVRNFTIERGLTLQSLDEKVPPTPYSVEGLYDFCISQQHVIPTSQTLMMIKSKLRSHQEDLQSDDWIPVCLSCPLTRTRIEVPVRSVNCEHVQCFDLNSYLTINRRRPRWTCPVCSVSAYFRDIRRDDFFLSILADVSLKEVEFVRVDAEGRWVRAKGLETASSSPSKDLEPSRQPPPLLQAPALLNGAPNTGLFSSPLKPETTTTSHFVISLDEEDDEEEQTASTPTPTLPPPLPPICTNLSAQSPPPTPSPQFGLYVDLTVSSDDDCPPIQDSQSALLPDRLTSCPQSTVSIASTPVQQTASLGVNAAPITALFSNTLDPLLVNAIDLNFKLFASLTNPAALSKLCLPHIVNTASESSSHFSTGHPAHQLAEPEVSRQQANNPARFKVTTRRRCASPPCSSEVRLSPRGQEAPGLPQLASLEDSPGERPRFKRNRQAKKKRRHFNVSSESDGVSPNTASPSSASPSSSPTSSQEDDDGDTLWTPSSTRRSSRIYKRRTSSRRIAK